MGMWVSGDYAHEVLKAARVWQDARRAAVAGGIERFETKGKDQVPVPNLDVWKALADAETALSAAIDTHRSIDHE